MVSCGDDDDNTPTPVDPLDSQANLLNGNWQVKDSNSVTKDGTIVDVFTAMTLNISGGSSYQVTGNKLTSSVGSLRITNWSVIDDSQNADWKNVSLAA